MWDMPSKKIVVGVEDAGCAAALRVAAAAARRSRCGIHVVHVVAPFHAAGEAAGELVLAEARERLVRLLREGSAAVPVSTELCHGAVTPELVAAAAHARVLVLQHRGMGPDGHPRGLSVTLGVVARTRAPVLAVPDSWGSEPSVEKPVVTVGVVDPTSSSGVLRAALAEADGMGARVLVVNAVGLPGSDKGPLANARAETAAALRHREDGLEAGFVHVCREHPHVHVEVEVVPERPEVALVGHARGSSLLVVGRRHSRMSMAPRLGHVVRAALRRSSCPVLVVDPGPRVVPAPRGLAGVAVP
jgi:nucleotide-binding universal stress UspA family protein